MEASFTKAPRRRLRIRVEGVVQGVGFRPCVFRLAGSLELSGEAREQPSALGAAVAHSPQWQQRSAPA
ncbi:MAG: acylphosphatase [Gemmatimonadota bacterium]|nr:acylphosphatase [Gemmatimonadota bacterium]